MVCSAAARRSQGSKAAMSASEDAEHLREVVPEGHSTSPEGEFRSLAISAEESFVGPIPPPWALREYEDILPGSADRILSLAERQAEARQKILSERVRLSGAALSEDGNRTRRGMYIGAALGGGLLVVAVVLALEGATWPAVAAAISQLAPTLAVFIPNARARRRNRRAQ